MLNPHCETDILYPTIHANGLVDWRTENGALILYWDADVKRWVDVPACEEYETLDDWKAQNPWVTMGSELW